MHRVLSRPGVPILVFVVALVVLGFAAPRVSLWGDESANLTPAFYFRLFFVERNITHPEWGDNYFIHTHPIISRYIVGGWLWLRGYDLDAMPRRYDFTNSYEENKRKGRVPEDALLLDARLPSVLLGAGAITIVYLLGHALGGVPVGLVGAGLALASPLSREHLVRVMQDAPLAFFALLTLYFSVVGAQWNRGGSLPLGWAVLVGLALSLAVGSKIPALFSVAAIVAWIGLLVITRLWSGAGRSGARGSLAAAVSGWALALVVAAVAFVAPNPHFYSNPILHASHFFEHRFEHEVRRQREVPMLAVRDSLDSLARVAQRSLVDGMAAGSAGVPVEAALAAIGSAAMVVVAARRWWVDRQLTPEAFVMLTVASYFTGTAAGLYLDYDRYYVPTVLLGALLSGVGAGALLRAVGEARSGRALLRPAAPGGTVAPRWR